MTATNSNSRPWYLSLPISIVAVAVLGLLSGVIHRLFLHPLSKVPGPKLAALTYLYQFYFNIVAGSRFYAHVEKLHERYGPAVRIGPNEVHLSDPDNYEKIYNSGTNTVSNEVHRVRRGALNPLFSRMKVLDLENVVQSKAQKLVRHVTQGASRKKPVDLHHAFRAVSVDVITDYAFDDCYNCLDHDDFNAEFFSNVHALGAAVWFFQQWPILQPVGRNIPVWLAAVLSKPLERFMKMQIGCRQQIVGIKSRIEAGEEKQTRTTIFHQLLNPNATEGHVVPSVDQMKDEAYVMLSAAADTTGNAMTIAAFHVISNESIYRRLCKELEGTFPDPSLPLHFLILEKLPYLTGVIKEGLR
ncbi:MAG: hypothetical protein M1833_001611 [Piccolia ochrophora]|nr:MAG: hypothetical protein M1833_001611 [Piccolia ochrophora]